MANPYTAVFRDDNSDTRLAGAIDFTDPANQPGGSQSVLSASLTLTDAEIKSLPTTSYEIVAAQGAGTVVVPIISAWVVDAAAGAYTNFNPVDLTNPFKSSVYLVLDALNNFNDASGPIIANAFLGHAQVSYANVGHIVNAEAINATSGGDNAFEFSNAQDVSTGYENSALYVGGQNNTLGNFTGGDPANSMTVAVFYGVLTF